MNYLLGYTSQNAAEILIFFHCLHLQTEIRQNTTKYLGTKTTDLIEIHMSQYTRKDDKTRSTQSDMTKANRDI